MDLPLDEANWPVAGPSALPYQPGVNQVPRELALTEMAAIRDQFVAATEAAARAGFDLLELHCAHGYLLSSFITPLSNQRTDRYGGSLANRLRTAEVPRAARPGRGRPMSVRISATTGPPAATRPRMVIARHSAAGAMVDVSSGQTTREAQPVYGRMYQTPFADRIRNEVGIATIAVGAISCTTT
jgi:anthraniloyl-CoA monooxygenase